MKISQIFYSIEGEGIEIGRPEVFIRLAGCNLRCKWCDTKYSWENGKEMSIKEIIDAVAKYPCQNISITGGEPLLQKDNLSNLVHRLKEMDYWIQINTNGTLFDKKIFGLVDLISMDCKCPSSGMRSDLRTIKKTKDLFDKKSQFKFVIANKKDYEYAKNICLSLFNDMTKLVFQPEWGNRNFIGKLVNLIRKDGLNVKIILQQQKNIWGNKKGI